MSDFSEISAEEAWHTEYKVFLFTLEALSHPPVEQCKLMGDFNTAWELKDDALCGHYLLGSGFFTERQEAAVIEFLTAIDPVPANDMPSGADRETNLAAMQHPAWQPIRSIAQHLLGVLEPVTRANRAYFQGVANAP
jgi:hypothetical protein